jgi:hypothetical protein
MSVRQAVDHSLVRDIKRAQRHQIEAGDRFRRLAKGWHGATLSQKFVADIRDAGAEYRAALFHLRKTLIRYSKSLNARDRTTGKIESPTRRDGGGVA